MDAVSWEEMRLTSADARLQRAKPPDQNGKYPPSFVEDGTSFCPLILAVGGGCHSHHVQVLRLFNDTIVFFLFRFCGGVLGWKEILFLIIALPCTRFTALEKGQLFINWSCVNWKSIWKGKNLLSELLRKYNVQTEKCEIINVQLVEFSQSEHVHVTKNLSPTPRKPLKQTRVCHPKFGHLEILLGIKGT